MPVVSVEMEFGSDDISSFLNLSFEDVKCFSPFAHDSARVIFLCACAGPRACYDEGKRVAETLAYAYAKQSNVSVRQDGCLT